MRLYDTDNNPLDYCRGCFPRTLLDAAELLDEPSSLISHDADHPPYSDTDYQCEECAQPLTDIDNGGPHN
jgi:hypothetical protein